MEMAGGAGIWEPGTEFTQANAIKLGATCFIFCRALFPSPQRLRGKLCSTEMLFLHLGRLQVASSTWPGAGCTAHPDSEGGGAGGHRTWLRPIATLFFSRSSAWKSSSMACGEGAGHGAAHKHPVLQQAAVTSHGTGQVCGTQSIHPHLSAPCTHPAPRSPQGLQEGSLPRGISAGQAQSCEFSACHCFPPAPFTAGLPAEHTPGSGGGHTGAFLSLRSSLRSSR